MFRDGLWLWLYHITYGTDAECRSAWWTWAWGNNWGWTSTPGEESLVFSGGFLPIEGSFATETVPFNDPHSGRSDFLLVAKRGEIEYLQEQGTIVSDMNLEKDGGVGQRLAI